MHSLNFMLAHETSREFKARSALTVSTQTTEVLSKFNILYLATVWAIDFHQDM